MFITRGSSNHRWFFFHLAGFWFAMAMRLIPRRRRFRVAVLVSRAALPLIRRTEAYREQRKAKVDGIREIALYLILDCLTKHGTRFDPVINVTHYENVERALAAGKGVLSISPHTVLSLFLARLFHDAGHDPVIVTADPRMRVGGTILEAETIQPSPTFLVAIRNRLRGGRLVCAMLDRAEAREGRTVEFATSRGRIIIATALIRVAARSETSVVFSEAHLDERGIVITFAPPSSSSDAADAITRDFIEFVRTHIETRSPKDY
jgi:lauroyl/myristoyl acyltransferase